jgi:hypothetical protein
MSRLNGDRNQCPTCDIYFNSSIAFSKHRVGRHGIDRRCMTEPEMLAAGMGLNTHGYWTASVMPEEEKLRRKELYARRANEDAHHDIV